LQFLLFQGLGITSGPPQNGSGNNIPTDLISLDMICDCIEKKQCMADAWPGRDSGRSVKLALSGVKPKNLLFLDLGNS